MRYHRALNREIGQVLNRLTDQDLPPNWGNWVEWAGKHPEMKSFSDYLAWKSSLSSLFEEIDPGFLRFVNANIKIAPGSRIEEIVWGGVRVEGISALENPRMVDPARADYLVPDERVFGVSINGETRAYPARFLDWHEMFNDVIGGQPVSLAY